jgi:hypothetical protein
MTVTRVGVTKTAEAVVVTVAIVVAEPDGDVVVVEDVEGVVVLKETGVNGAGLGFGHVG